MVFLGYVVSFYPWVIFGVFLGVFLVFYPWGPEVLVDISFYQGFFRYPVFLTHSLLCLQGHEVGKRKESERKE